MAEPDLLDLLIEEVTLLLARAEGAGDTARQAQLREELADLERRRK